MSSLSQPDSLNQIFYLWLLRNVLPAYRETPRRVYGTGPAPKAIIENVRKHLSLDPHLGCWEWEGSCPANRKFKALRRWVWN